MSDFSAVAQSLVEGNLMVADDQMREWLETRFFAPMGFPGEQFESFTPEEFEAAQQQLLCYSPAATDTCLASSNAIVQTVVLIDEDNDYPSPSLYGKLTRLSPAEQAWFWSSVYHYLALYFAVKSQYASSNRG